MLQEFGGFILFLILMTIGYLSGRMMESRHYKSIAAREDEFLSLPAVSLKTHDGSRSVTKASLVTGSAVISIDYFKQFLAGLRGLFGGRVTSYESLIDRARREAILRMKEAGKHADIILNMRIETSSISKGRKGNVSSVEALAYGTAVKYGAGAVVPPPMPSAAMEAAPEEAESRYKVVFSGELAEGQERDAVKARIAALYNVSIERCESMFSGKTMVVKSGLDAQSAQKYKNAFEKTGARCRIVKM
jgi:uncharacterized protein YbjQ (UPF0145 family)